MAKENLKEAAGRIARVLREKLSDVEFADLRRLHGDYTTDEWLCQALAAQPPRAVAPDRGDESLSAGVIIDARALRRDKFDWTPSKEGPSFPVWIMDEMKRAHGGNYYPHPPYTDLGIMLLESLGLWPWRVPARNEIEPFLERYANRKQHGTELGADMVLDELMAFLNGRM